jgi:hypothetical protein
MSSIASSGSLQQGRFCREGQVSLTRPTSPRTDIETGRSVARNLTIGLDWTGTPSSRCLAITPRCPLHAPRWAMQGQVAPTPVGGRHCGQARRDNHSQRRADGHWPEEDGRHIRSGGPGLVRDLRRDSSPSTLAGLHSLPVSYWMRTRCPSLSPPVCVLQQASIPRAAPAWTLRCLLRVSVRCYSTGRPCAVSPALSPGHLPRWMPFETLDAVSCRPYSAESPPCGIWI